MTESGSDKLLVLWTSGERETALNMVFMYTLNACLNKWWHEVTLLVWGAAGKLLAEDPELQEKIPSLKKAGVRVVACKKCAENQATAESLQNIGIEVFYTGTFLTDWLKSGDKVLSV